MLHMLLSTVVLSSLASVWAAPTCELSTPPPALAASVSATPSSSAPAVDPTPSAQANATEVDMVSITWYTGWHSQYLPIESISWDKYTAVHYAFAITEENASNPISLAPEDDPKLRELVSTAHSKGVKAVLTIGGWTGSVHFSDHFSSASGRSSFAQAVVALVDEYNLDGIDIDWEYPANQGIGCNTIDVDNDGPNFALFLQLLRPQLSANVTLSAAVSTKPYGFNASGSASTLAANLDYIEVMDYDVWGSWDEVVGPNTPLDDSCANSNRQHGSAVSGVNAWVEAGIPPHQIVLGVASYGHSFFVNKTVAFADDGSTLVAYPNITNATVPQGDDWDAVDNTRDVCGKVSNAYSGNWNFVGMIDRGVLTANGTAAPGFPSRFDDCAQTPFLYIPENETMISYDDPTSFAAKGKFIVEKQLRGFAMWEAASDSNDLLLDSILTSMGVDPADSGDDC